MRSMETLGKIPKYLIVLVILSLETMGLIRLIFQSSENEYYLAMLIENILDIVDKEVPCSHKYALDTFPDLLPVAGEDP